MAKDKDSVVVEICCGSYYDCLQAAEGGAKRVELNCALHMDGLTPSLGSLMLTKRDTDLQVIPMLRPRGAGFCYNDADYALLLLDLRLMLDNGADGIAYGCLTPSGLDVERTKEITGIIKDRGREAVFHKAFDCCPDADEAMETLIGLGVDRVLTSGLAPKAPQGKDMLKHLQAEYGSRIEILAGGGVNESNVAELLRYTGCRQVHSSCKDWLLDESTIGRDISFAYAQGELASHYEVVNADKVQRLVKACSEV